MLTLPSGGEGSFRLFGAMTDAPAEMWQEEDAVDVTFVFSFIPLETQMQAEAPLFPAPADMEADYGW